MGGRKITSAWGVVLRGLTVARCVEKDLLHVSATNDGARVELEPTDVGHRLPAA
jgi:hypothetical protein